MTTQKIYQLPGRSHELEVRWCHRKSSSTGNTTPARPNLLNLYEKGKQQQWDTSTRLDWSQELFEGNPMGMSDETIPIYGSPFWEKMTEKERDWLRFNLQCHSICPVSCTASRGALIAHGQDR